MNFPKATRLAACPIELSVRATSGAWTTSATPSRNTAITAGSLNFLDEFCTKRGQYLTQGAAIPRRWQFRGHLKSFDTLTDASDQHFLFIPNEGVKLAL